MREKKYAPNKFKDIHKSKTPTFIYAQKGSVINAGTSNYSVFFQVWINRPIPL